MPERYVGKTLGKYRVDALLGSGGFAWVYRAYDPELDIQVALKILKPQYGGDPKFETRFKREASTAAKLRHPNIVKIYAVGSEDGAVYFAMDFLPTGLADKIDVMGTVPENMLVRTAIDVASALAYAHREGIIHRDIKTDNIMYDEHGNAVVCDFGIAKAVSGYVGETGTDMVVGTPQYFSPEQARAQPLDGRADLYSLGVTLFKSSTGTLPFQGTDWYEVARQQVEEKPPRPRSLNPSISKDFERIILRLLEKSPEERYLNGEALCEDLVALLQSMGESPPVRTLQIPAGTPSGARSPLPRSLRMSKQKLKRHARWAIPALIVAALIPVAVTARDGASKTTDSTAVAASGSTPARDTVPPAPPTPRHLAITSPATATVTLEGTKITSGSWESDSILPGRYQVVATMPGSTACNSLTDRRTVTVLDTGRVNVRMSPRGCGSVRIDAPADVAVTLKMTGEKSVALKTPVKSPVLLPVGVWTTEGSKPRCFVKPDRVRITENTTATLRIRPVC